MELLVPWAGREEGTYSIAALGGAKKEKITIGFTGFVETYDMIIPVGITLNTILKVRGHEIGDSVIKDGGKSFEKEVQDASVSHCGHRVCVPDKAIIAKRAGHGFVNANEVKISEGVPKGYLDGGRKGKNCVGAVAQAAIYSPLGLFFLSRLLFFPRLFLAFFRFFKFFFCFLFFNFKFDNLINLFPAQACS